MIIDLHFHTDRFSPCSRMPLSEGLKRAKEIGLDGVCITEHDQFHQNDNLQLLSDVYGIKIFVGTEIYTKEGDILCFGLDTIPQNRITARELVQRMETLGGATVAAHPFRDNFRGIGELIVNLPGLTAVEAFNGNTSDEHNQMALDLAREKGIPLTGSSDAHSAERVGIFATEFPGVIENMDDLIRALRSGDCTPVRFTGEPGCFKSLV